MPETEITSRDFLNAWLKALSAIESKYSVPSGENTSEENYVPDGFRDVDLEEIVVMSDEEAKNKLGEIGYSDEDISRNIAILTSSNVFIFNPKKGDAPPILQSKLLSVLVREVFRESYLHPTKEADIQLSHSPEVVESYQHNFIIQNKINNYRGVYFIVSILVVICIISIVAIFSSLF